jgi:branched-chain amino acid transport system substrate-binding protein
MVYLRRRLLLAAMLLPAAGLAQAQAELPVGIFNATTGVYAFGGVPIQNGMRLALEEANKAGLPGGAKFRIVEGDTAGDKGQTINLVNQFTRRDRVVMILGPTTSVEALAAAPMVNDLKVPMITGASATDILAAGPYSLKIAARATDVMGFLAQHAVQKMNVRKVAFVFDQGNEGFVAQKNAMRDSMRKLGATIAEEDGIQASDSNFLALATKLASQDLDAVFMAAPAELSANFFVQLRQAGLPPKVRFLGPPTFASQGFIKTGGKAVEGTVLIADYSPANPHPVNQAFITAYRARYNAAPDNWAAMGYTVGLLAVQAVRNAGPGADREKIREQVTRLKNVPVPIGINSWNMDAERNANYGGAVLVVKDGAFAAAP